MVQTPKPPVNFGNLGFPGEETTASSPAMPDYRSQSRTKRNAVKLGSGPLSAAECLQVLRAINMAADKKRIALTFDDGPHATLTPLLLDFLKANKVPSTFFVLGSRAETYPDLVSKMANEGHEVANHTWKHISLANQTTSKGLASLVKTADLIAGLTGKSCNFVRPPFGHTNARVRNMIESQGWHQVMWDADSRDWQETSSRRILWRVLRELTPNGIILFHDIHPGALQVLPVLVPALKMCGFQFVTISELFKIPNEAS